MPGRGLQRALATAVLAALFAAGVGPATAGGVRGRVVLDVAGLELAQAGSLIVYLEPLEGQAWEVPSVRPSVRQKHARFAPGFLAVSVDQTVEMPNDDTIYHNVFSFSAPNDFDLGLYPAAESRSVTFRHPGVVRIYCSIHESMSAVLFVAPTRYFTAVDSQGGFALAEVPEGRWRVRTWAETLPSVERQIDVGDGVLEVELRLSDGA